MSEDIPSILKKDLDSNDILINTNEPPLMNDIRLNMSEHPHTRDIRLNMNECLLNSKGLLSMNDMIEPLGWKRAIPKVSLAISAEQLDWLTEDLSLKSLSNKKNGFPSGTER